MSLLPVGLYVACKCIGYICISVVGTQPVTTVAMRALPSCTDGCRCFDCVVVGYTMDTMYFTWLDKPVDVDGDLQLPQFFLVDTPKFDCSQNYTAGTLQSSYLSLL